MLGVARAVTTHMSEGGSVLTPSILGTVTTDVNSVPDHTTDNTAHTVTAGTEVLLLAVNYGQNGTVTGAETTPSSDVDGDFDVLDASALGVSSTSALPRWGLYAIEAPTAGAHTVTWGRAAGLTYSAVVLINLDDVDTADPFGDLINVEEFVSNVDTFDDTVTTEKANSLIIVGGAWQGGDTDPFTEDDGLTELVEFQTGTAGTADSAMSIATKTGPATPGNTAIGMTSSSADQYAYFAIEIRGVG